MNETLPALLALKAQGLVRHIGITGLPLKIFRYVLDRCGQCVKVPWARRCAACTAFSCAVDLALLASCAGWRAERCVSAHHLPGCRRVPAGSVDTALSYCHYTLNDRSLEACVRGCECR